MKLLCYLWGMISQDVIEAAAQRLREAQAQGEPCAPVRELIGEANIEAAYAVQKVNNDLRKGLWWLDRRLDLHPLQCRSSWA